MATPRDIERAYRRLLELICLTDELWGEAEKKDREIRKVRAENAKNN